MIGADYCYVFLALDFCFFGVLEAPVVGCGTLGELEHMVHRGGLCNVKVFREVARCLVLGLRVIVMVRLKRAVAVVDRYAHVHVCRYIKMLFVIYSVAFIVLA